MDVQLRSSGLEVDVAEGLKVADFHLGELDEDAAISRESLEVGVALPIEVGAHFLNLKIGHITYPGAQCALVGPGPAELESLYQAPVGEHLARGADDLAETDIVGEDADNVGAAGNPDKGFVLIRLQLAFGVDLEKLGMQRSLKEAERQFLDGYIDMW